MPDVQQKIYDELEQAIGHHRLPTMLDKRETPFTEAFMLEVQRLNTLIPLAVGHSCHSDIEFMGYTIPAYTTILSNLSAAHTDDRVFETPMEFRPERFLKDGKVVNADKVNQFGIGECPSTLAR